ncbi:MAG: hypothetical protein ACREOO_22180 [bacterium]
MPTAPGSIMFMNESVYVVSVHRGNVLVLDLAPTESSVQSTVEGEVWSVIDKDTAQQVGMVTGTNGEQTYRIKFKRSRGEPVRSGSGGG